MKLNPNAFGLAATGSVVSLAVLVMVLAKLLSLIFGFNVQYAVIDGNAPLWANLLALALFVLVPYLFAFIMAWIYNKLVDKK